MTEIRKQNDTHSGSNGLVLTDGTASGFSRRQFFPQYKSLGWKWSIQTTTLPELTLHVKPSFSMASFHFWLSMASPVLCGIFMKVHTRNKMKHVILFGLNSSKASNVFEAFFNQLHTGISKADYLLCPDYFHMTRCHNIALPLPFLLFSLFTNTFFSNETKKTRKPENKSHSNGCLLSTYCHCQQLSQQQHAWSCCTLFD